MVLGRQKFTNVEIMLITALAGSASSLATSPFWVVNTRMAIERKTEDEENRQGLCGVIKDIYCKEGIAGFFKGAVPNLILVTNPIINFVIYEAVKRNAIKKYGAERKIPFGTIFIMSSVAKIVATFATYPILTIKV